ncbi:MAG: phosphopentomutase [Alphaproteobacteria bacterium]|nr:phosphopentomutase [Alphaproteobacteria bacterium]MDE2110649.1 phosphopentomutase [Alphaproteobacteria bacterium]MDE2495078.1 phosphopentomutase [Alphaproteobacteria bacterium]
MHRQHPERPDLRAIIAVLDSLGIGSAPDANCFGDAGANTFGHIADVCTGGKLGRGPLRVPNLFSLGLALAAHEADPAVAMPPSGEIVGRYGAAAELSKGKDTPSGHWEMMGLPVETDWGYFPRTVPTFPAALTEALVERARLPGVLGNCHASGTEIIDRLGTEHIRTGKPICYTSADSVFQIAAHETHFGLERLYEVCEIARGLVDDYNVGRVIARPFVGERSGEFKRTANRHDYATPPHKPTLLDVAKAQGSDVIAIGKISDIFAGSGITRSLKADGNDKIFDTTIECAKTAPDGSITFANFVDFDQSYGHRRDVAGYAAALEAFDARISELRAALRPGDLVVFSADHGCDPTWSGTDHTREYVPILAFGPGIAPGPVGIRKTFADIGQSIAKHLGLSPLPVGTSFL